MLATINALYELSWGPRVQLKGNARLEVTRPKAREYWCEDIGHGERDQPTVIEDDMTMLHQMCAC
jgi:hypothetical protein